MAQRRFSHAIAEGDGISVIAAVEDPDSARAAEEQRAEALVVRGDPGAVRDATLAADPLARRRVARARRRAVGRRRTCSSSTRSTRTTAGSRSCTAQALELGLDCAVEVRDEEELEQALERVDPEIFLLSPAERDDDETPLEVVLDLLAAVPAGKLAIADLPLTTRDEVLELERAGCDAVIVHGADVSPLVGGPPPEV